MTWTRKRSITKKYGENCCSLIALEDAGLHIDTTYFSKKDGVSDFGLLWTIEKQRKVEIVYDFFRPYPHTALTFAKKHPIGNFILVVECLPGSGWSHAMACRRGKLLNQGGWVEDRGKLRKLCHGGNRPYFVLKIGNGERE